VPEVLYAGTQGNTLHQTDLPHLTPSGYDVVSITINRSKSSHTDVDSTDRTYIATNIRIKQLLETAYGIKEDLITGIPAPLVSTRFDIQAKLLEVPPDLHKSPNLKEGDMVRAFLINRFALQAHIESKIEPVYELVVAAKKSKLIISSDAISGPDIRGNGAYSFNARNLTMDDLANLLSDKLHRTVTNKTSLIGRYDFVLSWSSDDSPTPSSEDRPVLFTALQEQLGLKLRSSKGLVRTLVVDHIEMPTPN
jgi:uncharacterized protein (TIGR03435 family)